VPNIISIDLIQETFEPAVLSRGMALLQANHVKTPKLLGSRGSSQLYEAEVIGSGGDRYSTHLFISPSGIQSNCDCPYGSQCKHGAAVALALVRGQQSYSKDGYSAEPNALQTLSEHRLGLWLNALQRASHKESPAASGKSGSQLFYLVDLESAPVMLVPALRQRKKNGEWGRFDELGHHTTQRIRGLTREDHKLLELFEQIQSHSHLVSNRRFYPAFEIVDELGHVLLQRALSSGRALDMETKEPLTLGPSCRLTMEWQQTPEGQVLQPVLDPPPPDSWMPLQTNPLTYVSGPTIGRLETSLDTDTLGLLLAMPPIPDKHFPSVCLQLSQVVEPDAVDLPEELLRVTTVETATAKATLMGVRSPVNGVLPALRFSVLYGSHEITLTERKARDNNNLPQREEFVERDGETLRILRQFRHEFEFTQKLRRIPIGTYVFGDAGELWMPGEVRPELHVAAWHKRLPALQALFEQDGWVVEVDPSYQTRSSHAQISAEAGNHSGGWFDLKLDTQIDGVAHDTTTLISTWLAAGTPPVLPLKDDDGHWQMVDMSQLQPVLGLLTELFGGGNLARPVRLPAFKAMELNGLPAEALRQPASLKKLRQSLSNFHGLEPVEPDKKLQAELRDYQKHGLAWLMFLRQYGFGGILADDMGLGKTLQALAFVQKLKATRKLTRGALVVAPTSLIWNWLSEAEKFTPNLKCLMLHGLERKTRFDDIAGHDLIVTSYGLIQRDFEIYKNFEFDLVILDEAQNIKNTNAKTTRFVKQLSAAMRLCLTGTPLENHLGELWSLMDFALPGLLAEGDHFRRHFRNQVEAGNNERRYELSARVAPFMLRRTKAQVVHELPQKTEIVQTVELAKDQRALYETIRISMEKRVRDLLKEKGVARSHIEFLDALLKLRQACIDPRLVKLSQTKKVKAGAKMEWLIETMPELVEEGRKLLIFSQFTEMLELIDKELANLSIPFVKLTGRTRNRQKVIDEFQNGDVPVFLISLKAGGAGLNLTAADTVIHVDPWWNPAVENQATDRAHRIGQNKPVFVYKLVANGTVEEKIQALQKQKQALADALFDGTGKVGLPQSGEELLALFGR
jgi:superfamily II DNA or RNA helicase